MLKLFKLTATALAAVAVMSCAEQPATYEGTRAIALFPDAPERRDLGALTYLGGLHITHDDPRFGGWSSLEVSADGQSLLALSDSAYWMTAEILWNEAGELAAISDITITALLDRDGGALTGAAADSEAIAALDDDRYAVSFERQHRINAYAISADWAGLEGVVPDAIDLPAGAVDLPNNGGIEGLVTLSDGRLLAGIEYPLEDAAPRTLWRETAGGWETVYVVATPDYGLTALARHGRDIYALERYWRREDGNRVKIIRFPASDLAIDTVAQYETLGMLDAANSVDNFEGIAVIERNGETILLILSDDNYSDSQRTLLMAFAVGE